MGCKWFVLIYRDTYWHTGVHGHWYTGGYTVLVFSTGFVLIYWHWYSGCHTGVVACTGFQQNRGCSYIQGHWYTGCHTVVMVCTWFILTYRDTNILSDTEVMACTWFLLIYSDTDILSITQWWWCIWGYSLQTQTVICRLSHKGDRLYSSSLYIHYRPNVYLFDWSVTHQETEECVLLTLWIHLSASAWTMSLFTSKIIVVSMLSLTIIVSLIKLWLSSIFKTLHIILKRGLQLG